MYGLRCLNLGSFSVCLGSRCFTVCRCLCYFFFFYCPPTFHPARLAIHGTYSGGRASNRHSVRNLACVKGFSCPLRPILRTKTWQNENWAITVANGPASGLALPTHVPFWLRVGLWRDIRNRNRRGGAQYPTAVFDACS